MVASVIAIFSLSPLFAYLSLNLLVSIVQQANRHVTRIDVFWSLLHLLQQKNTSEMDSANNHYNVSDTSISGLDRQLPEKKKELPHSWP